MKTKLLFGLFLVATLQFTNAQSIGLIGDFNTWAADEVMSTSDNIDFTFTGLAITSDGGIKFRQDGAWTANWGSAGFPTGTGTQDGDNIPIVVGTYDVTFNITSGAYTFTNTATAGIGDDFIRNVKFYYTNNSLSVKGFTGKITVKAFDMLGRALYQGKTINIQNNYTQELHLPSGQMSIVIIEGENFTKSLKVIQ